jgi:hypothetical protein
MPKLRPFLSRSSDDPHCHLIVGIGLCWGKRGAPLPDGRVAFWLFRHCHIWRRTEESDGSVREHYRLSALDFELEVGPQILRVDLRPCRLPRFEIDTTTA